MRMLGFLGSLAALAYLVGFAVMTWHNLSKLIFGGPFEEHPRRRFLMRQCLILFWPLVLSSAEGRRAIRVIWKGEWDHDEA